MPNDRNPNPEWLGLAAVAAKLGCSAETARQLCLSGKLPSVSIASGERRHYRVHADAVRKFLDDRAIQPAPPVAKGAPGRQQRDRNLCGM